MFRSVSLCFPPVVLEWELTGNCLAVLMGFCNKEPTYLKRLPHTHCLLIILSFSPTSCNYNLPPFNQHASFLTTNQLQICLTVQVKSRR